MLANCFRVVWITGGRSLLSPAMTSNPGGSPTLSVGTSLLIILSWRESDCTPVNERLRGGGLQERGRGEEGGRERGKVGGEGEREEGGRKEGRREGGRERGREEGGREGKRKGGRE